MILIFSFVAFAVIALAVSLYLHRSYASSELVIFTGMLAVVSLCFAAGVSFGALAQRASQQRVVELHGELAQLLKLVDAKEDPAFSASVRVPLARMIGEVNKAVSETKEYNDGLLDIWCSDDLAAREPLK